MAYTPPTGSTSPSWQGASSYVGASPPVSPSWRAGYVAPSGIAAQYGVAFVTQQQFIRPAGITGVFGHIYAERKGAYIPPDRGLDASWFGRTVGYNPVADGALNAQWNDPFTSARTILGSGFDSSAFGAPQIPQPVGAVGFDSLEITVPRLYRDDEYVPPYAIINGSWFNAPTYELPTAIVNGQWQKIDAPPGLVQTFGADHAEYGLPSIVTAEQLKPAPFVATEYGTARVINWHSFVRTTGMAPGTWNATNSGNVRNWRQPATLSGINAFAAGTPTVRNATATQRATVSGIASERHGTTIVNPRTIYPSQFNASRYGNPNVQLPPRPVGWASSVMGRPTVLDNRQTVYPVGFDASLYGQPTSLRLQEYVYPPSLLETGVFGDAQPILRQRYVLAPAVDDGFISPFASVDNRNRHVLPFAIPSTAFGTGEAYNKSPNFTPFGFDSLVFGTTDVGHRYRVINVANMPPLGAGRPSVANAAATVAPSGFNAFRTTEAVVTHRVRTVRATGFDAARYDGNTRTWFRVRSVTPDGLDATIFGTARNDLKDRRVLEAGISTEDRHGTPTVWFGVRTIPLTGRGIGFLTGRQFGATTVQDATRRLNNAGAIAPGLFGVADARRNEVVVSPAGLTGEIGTAFVDLGLRYVEPRTFTVLEEFGLSDIFNSRQYVAPFSDPDSELLRGGVGTPWSIENRDRIMGAFGFDMSTVSNAGTVELTGRDIHPAGTEMLNFGTAVLGERVRYVRAEGFDAFFARYSTVYNRAAVLEPSGIRAGQAGVPTMRDLRQITDAVGGNMHTVFGDQFIAFAIRTVDVTPGIEDPRMMVQTVDLWQRYIDVAGMEGGAGVPFVEEHFNVIGAKGYPMDRYGEALVVNVTPEVKVYPSDLTEFGRNRVFNRNSFVEPDSFTTIWGRNVVDYRLKTVRPGGFEAMRIPTHDVFFDAPQIPPATNVYPNGFYANGTVNGTEPAPDVYLRGMYVVGLDAERFGTPSVVSQGIGPVSIIWVASQQFGTPTLNPVQFIDVPTIEFKSVNSTPGIPQPGVGREFIGQPRITPMTVSLSVLLDPEYEIDYRQNNTPRHPFWGSARVTQRNRTIDVNSIARLDFGDHDVQLRKRFVNPVGFSSWRYGIPVIPSNWEIRPFWGRYTEEDLPGETFDTAEYGVTRVSRPVVLGPQTVRPSSITAAYGTTRVDLFNRTITRAGAIYSNVFTGSTRVGPPTKLLMRGADSLVFGTLAAGLKYRYLQVDSTDLDTIWGVSFGGGALRPMTVRLGRRLIETRPIAPGGLGLPYAGLRQQGVSVPGAQNGAMGGPAVLSRAEIAPAGFGSLRMGIPKRPVYGTLEPQGEDMALYGIPGLDLGVHAPYIEPGLAGTPRVQRRVSVLGLEDEFGDTVVVGESNCGSTLAVIPLLGDTSKIGQHGVSR